MKNLSLVLVFTVVGGLPATNASGLPPAMRLDRPISRAQAVKIGVQRNFGLLIARLERSRQALGILAAKRQFVPALDINLGYANRTPFDRTLPRDQRLNYGAVLRWNSQIGTQVNGGVNVDQSIAGSTPQSQSFNTSQHASAASLSVTQPLLRGAWKTGAATPLKQAEVDRLIQRESFRASLNQLIVDIEQAYSALAFAQADITIKRRSVKRAKRQYDDTKENIRRGLLAAIEIYVVDENWVFFRQQLLQSEQNLILARRRLAQLLQIPSHSKVSASEKLKDLSLGGLDTAKAQRIGLNGNPLLRQQQLALAGSRVQAAFQKNQSLPNLDLATSFRLNGLDENYGTQWGEVVQAKRPEFTIGLRLSIPLDWRTNRSEFERAKIEVKKSLVRLKQEEVRVRYRVANLVTQLVQQRKALALAKKRVELNRLKLTAEQQKYKNGLTTLADVVRFQRELDQSMIAQQQVQRQLYDRRVELLQAQGTLHQQHGISLERK